MSKVDAHVILGVLSASARRALAVDRLNAHEGVISEAITTTKRGQCGQTHDEVSQGGEDGLRGSAGTGLHQWASAL